MAGAEVIVGILGVVIALLPLIFKVRRQTKNFGPALDKLQDTMELIAPKIEELDRMNQQKDHDKLSEDVIPVFKRLLEEGKKLVTKCKALPGWNKIKKYKYAKKLVELDACICRLLNIEYQAGQSVHIYKEKMKLHTC